jgi:hypothetical protein
MDPLLGIHALVNAPFKDQRIPLKDAIRAFTIDAAKIAFEENWKGTIEVGKNADLVVLSDDPFTVDQRRIKDIRVLMTIVSGNIAYEALQVKT